MLKLVFVVLSFVLYCAYSLVVLLSTNTGSQEEAPAEQTISKGFSLGGATELALNAAIKTSGMELVALPDAGCSDSMLPPERVQALVHSLPEPQRTTLATVMNASSSVWTAQLYKGEKGVGLCLPVHERLVVLPASVNTAVDAVGAAVTPIQDGLARISGQTND